MRIALRHGGGAMVSGSAPSAFGDRRTHSLRWIQPSNAAEAAVSAWRYVMHHTAAGPCFALTEAPLTQRCSFFFSFSFSLPILKAYSIVAVTFSGHAVTVASAPALAHMMMEPCNNIWGVWETCGPFSRSSAAQNLRVGAAVGDNGP